MISVNRGTIEKSGSKSLTAAEYALLSNDLFEDDSENFCFLLWYTLQASNKHCANAQKLEKAFGMPYSEILERLESFK